MKVVEVLLGIATFITTGAAAVGWVMVLGLGASSIPSALIWSGLAALCWWIWRVLDNGDKRKASETAEIAERAQREERERQSLPADWQHALSAKGFDSQAVGELTDTAYRQGWARVFPRRDQTFRAFRLTSLSNTRVVILGQDPYPNPGDADGLAFSVEPGRQLPQALRTIYSALEADPAANFKRPSSGDLSGWAEQGVLLINCALTAKDRDGSQVELWRPFIRAVLEVVDERKKPVVVIAFGSPAAELAASVVTQHPVLQVAHPTAQGATRLQRVKESRAFSQANQILAAQGAAQIRW